MEENVLTPALVTQNLKTVFIGQKVIHYPVLESTMDAAWREARWGAEAGTVVIADVQTAGRGRLQRAWCSPGGNLSFSVILRPNRDYLPHLIMLASLAVTYSIQIITGLKPQIKWPNDILVRDKKICGILIENELRKNSLRFSVIGIGINVNMDMMDYPEIEGTATSLSAELGRKVSRLDILRQVLTEMDRLYPSLQQSDFILEQWKKYLVTLGQRVQVNLGDKVYKGIAESVCRDGSLMLRQKDGKLTRIIAGDVGF